MDEFYLYLPSNASGDVYPENCSNDFKINLAQPLHLDGNWKVALVEVTYQNTAKTISGGEIALYDMGERLRQVDEWILDEQQADSFDSEVSSKYIHVRLTLSKLKDETKQLTVRIRISPVEEPYKYAVLKLDTNSRTLYEKFEPFLRKTFKGAQTFEESCVISGDALPSIDFSLHIKSNPVLIKTSKLMPNHYETVKELCDSLNRQLETNAFHVMPDQPNRIYVTNLPLGHQFHLSEGLRYILGFQTDWIGSVIRHVAEFEAQLNLSFAMYIYSNMIRETRVGDAFVPLLRTLPSVRGRYGDIVNFSVHNPYYLDIAGTEFSTLHIAITDKAGKPFPLAKESDMLLVLKFINKH